MLKYYIKKRCKSKQEIKITEIKNGGVFFSVSIRLDFWKF